MASVDGRTDGRTSGSDNRWRMKGKLRRAAARSEQVSRRMRRRRSRDRGEENVSICWCLADGAKWRGHQGRRRAQERVGSTAQSGAAECRPRVINHGRYNHRRRRNSSSLSVCLSARAAIANYNEQKQVQTRSPRWYRSNLAPATLTSQCSAYKLNNVMITLISTLCPGEK